MEPLRTDEIPNVIYIISKKIELKNAFSKPDFCSLFLCNHYIAVKLFHLPIEHYFPEHCCFKVIHLHALTKREYAVFKLPLQECLLNKTS